MLSTLATIWRLAAPYFSSEDRKAGRILLIVLIAIELSIVAINVLLNQWNARFYNALQERDWDAFVTQLMIFCALAAAYIALAVYRLYLNQWLQMRWRQWMTKVYLGEWLDHANHYRMQLLGDAADNPDQRISEDIQLFVERTLTIGIGLLSSLVTLGSFVVILWSLSAAAPVHLFGQEWNIPGYLVWAALIYAVIGTMRSSSCTFSSSASKPIFALTWCAFVKIPSRSRCSTVNPRKPNACSFASVAWSTIGWRS
jgi:vitamin B12/bleomycin/antimicrobial peptide transport system ATP-binding/permease protein